MQDDAGQSHSQSGTGSDPSAELAALEAEIARLTSRRDYLRSQAASGGTSLAKADWYPDPFGRFAWRYWNGRKWTDSVARNGVTYTDAPVPDSWQAPTATAGTGTPAEPATAAEPTASPTPVATSPSVAETTPAATDRPAATARPTQSFSTPETPWEATGPQYKASDIDIGRLILIVGAALLIGGVAGLTAWLWSQSSAIERLGLLGLAAAVQVVIALRIRERLSAAAEAFAATGVATLLFAVGSVSFTAGWKGTTGIAVGAVGILLLLVARFRAWVIAGHLAIVVGAVSLLVAEPWSQTACAIAVVIGITRWLIARPNFSFRPPDINVYPEVLTASGLATLLAAPALAIAQFGTIAAAGVYVLVAVALSEIAVRGRGSRVEREMSLVAAAAAAVGGVTWSASLWINGGRSDGLVAMSVTAVAAVLIWRVGNTDGELRSVSSALAVALVPVAARFACDPASDRELVIFCAGAAAAGLLASRRIGKPLGSSFWATAVLMSIVATEPLALWPRLVLATVALASLAVLLERDELRFASAVTATLAVADLLYGGTFEVTWWFRPDVVGAAAALFLFIANRTRREPWTVAVGSWTVPRYWESATALLVVPVVDLMTQPAFGDLPKGSLWRLGFVITLTVGAWGYGAVRRSHPNALQWATLVAVTAVVASRVDDSSPRIQTGAWVTIGCVATVVLWVSARLLKRDGLRYAAAVTATLTVTVLLYGKLIEVSWWFRPDVIGAAAAAFLFAANRAQREPRSAKVGSWTVPRYWESATALLVVPVVDLMSQPAFADLAKESLWRLGFVIALTVGAWGYGVVRRSRPNALQWATLFAVTAVVVSRVGDESLAVQTGAWVAIGCITTVAFWVSAVVLKRDGFRYAAAVTATLTVTVLLYGKLIEVSWWFRPDVIGAAAAAFLFAANRTQREPWTAKVGSWAVPRYWESATALVVVPVVDLMSQPAFADLPDKSVWRAGLVGTLTVGAWAYGAVRRSRPNALQWATLISVTAVILSRVGDESLAVQTGAWVAIGSIATVAFWVSAVVLKRDGFRFAAAVTATLTVTVLLYGKLIEVFAAIAGVVALIARRFGRTGSFDFIPATALALVPSSFAAASAVLDGTVDSEQVTRIVVVLVVGAIALAVGTYRRLAALVGPAVVALVALAVAQLIVVQRQTSGWVSALVAGIVLLVVGTRLEYLRSVSRRTGDLVRSLR